MTPVVQQLMRTDVPLSQADLAVLTGQTKEAVGRELTKLQHAGHAVRNTRFRWRLSNEYRSSRKRELADAVAPDSKAPKGPRPIPVAPSRAMEPDPELFDDEDKRLAGKENDLLERMNAFAGEVSKRLQEISSELLQLAELEKKEQQELRAKQKERRQKLNDERARLYAVDRRFHVPPSGAQKAPGHRGICRETMILPLLPATALELVKKVGIAESSVRWHLDRLVTDGRAVKRGTEWHPVEK